MVSVLIHKMGGMASNFTAGTASTARSRSRVNSKAGKGVPPPSTHWTV
jgi:hypothetical protein